MHEIRERVDDLEGRAMELDTFEQRQCYQYFLSLFHMYRKPKSGRERELVKHAMEAL
jgi:hypothetical protein